MFRSVGSGEAPFKQRVPEETIEERSLEIERKSFVISLKENHQGRFCRITEEAKGRRNSIIVPANGLPDFAKVFAELAELPKQGESVG